MAPTEKWYRKSAMHQFPAHQQLVESTAIDYKTGKRAITGYLTSNTQLEIITRYNLISVYVPLAILIAPGKSLSDSYVLPNRTILPMIYGGYNEIYRSTSFPNLARSKSEF